MRETSGSYCLCFVCLQIFKYKNIRGKFFPCLLPKSHSTVDPPPFTVPGSGKASVQVHMLTLTQTSSQRNAYLFTTNCSFIFIILLSFSQVLRSVDRWSAGTCESSILNAYIHTIENSEHYIYIEVTLLPAHYIHYIHIHIN